jgi:hypothetical protein
MSPSASAVLSAVKSSGVRYTLQSGWDDPDLNPYGSSWSPAYVIEHHTANGGAGGNAPSLGWVLSPGDLAPVRACHFLIGRDGLVYVVYALGCYHAGDGGPGRWGDGPQVNAGDMNRHAYGIEIESKGTSLSTSDSGGTNGITAAQYEATARLSAALLDLMGRSTACAINHRTWAPGRKSDTLVADGDWHDRIEPYRGGGAPPMPGDDPSTIGACDVFMYRTPNGKQAVLVEGGHQVNLDAATANNFLDPLAGPVVPYVQFTADVVARLNVAYGPPVA